jgi:hypothetical protein
MPGNFTSMEYCAEPLTLNGKSRRGTDRPIRRKSLGAFSSLFSTAGSGAGTLPKAAISP